MQVSTEGVVKFHSKPSTSYRFKIMANGDYIKLWLEDRASKFQWESSEFGLSDLPLFSPSAVVISIAQYISLFQCCPEDRSTPRESSDFQRDLIDCFNDGSHRLELTVALKADSIVWTPKFRIHLQPIPLEPIQIAEAKLRDQEKELAYLRYSLKTTKQELKRVETEKENVKSLFLKCSDSEGKVNDVLHWKLCEYDMKSIHFVVHPNERIQFHFTGAYKLVLLIRHPRQSDTDNHLFVARLYQAHGVPKKEWKVTNDSTNSHLACTISTTAGDELSVWSNENSECYLEGTLSIIPLG